ncbi:hypothetical protein GCM10010468_40250 [Actinocorallia longicatena]|uniref:Uncharacterized protein n=1 Tax=Actinocorallia longicatena TaxID=111803 RepID=A0ABP6QE74_9ACTN
MIGWRLPRSAAVQAWPGAGAAWAAAGSAGAAAAGEIAGGMAMTAQAAEIRSALPVRAAALTERIVVFPLRPAGRTGRAGPI